ncbi:MAG TPA: cell division protein FtsZ, partial [Sphingomicrobium sp.]|nr:cell division protein FtsZ [Sphingomicrobium sp.]
RVSVVATGIEAEVGVQPQPAKVFSFPKAAAVAKPAPVQVQPAEQDETPEDITAETDGEGGEELLLDSDDILTSPVGKPPIAPPADDDIATPAAATAATGGATSGGGTLFERMSNIARGAPKAQLDTEDETALGAKREPIDIPRFLNRQSNQ